MKLSTRLLFFSTLAWVGIQSEPVWAASASQIYRLGLGTHLLLPSRLPDFELSLPAFGPLLCIPLGEEAIQIQTLYGSRLGTHVLLSEADYQINSSTPFYRYFMLVGIHYLSYAHSENKRGFLGGNAGLGFSLPLGPSFELAISMKLYLQMKPMLTVGGGFGVGL